VKVAAAPAEPTPAARIKAALLEGRRLREQGRSEAALSAYNRVLDIDPTSADALTGRGLSYLDLSRYAPAEASFRAALDSDAQHGEALMGLAETYRYEGRRAEAVTYYRKYLAAHPGGEEANAARNAMDALKE
jgi:tetratricopeptide (TPR) repeat protein